MLYLREEEVVEACNLWIGSNRQQSVHPSISLICCKPLRTQEKPPRNIVGTDTHIIYCINRLTNSDTIVECNPFNVTSLHINHCSLTESLFYTCECPAMGRVSLYILNIYTVKPVLRGHPFCTVKLAIQDRWLFLGSLSITMLGNSK